MDLVVIMWFLSLVLWVLMAFCIYRLMILGKCWIRSLYADEPQFDVDISKAGYYDICLSRNILRQSASWPQTDFVITMAASCENSPFYKETYPAIKMKSGRMTGSSGYFFAPLPGKYLITNPNASGFLHDDALLIRKHVSSGAHVLWIGAVAVSSLLCVVFFIIPFLGRH